MGYGRSGSWEGMGLVPRRMCSAAHTLAGLLLFIALTSVSSPASMCRTPAGNASLAESVEFSVDALSILAGLETRDHPNGTVGEIRHAWLQRVEGGRCAAEKLWGLRENRDPRVAAMAEVPWDAAALILAVEERNAAKFDEIALSKHLGDDALFASEDWRGRMASTEIYRRRLESGSRSLSSVIFEASVPSTGMSDRLRIDVPTGVAVVNLLDGYACRATPGRSLRGDEALTTSLCHLLERIRRALGRE